MIRSAGSADSTRTSLPGDLLRTSLGVVALAVAAGAVGGASGVGLIALAQAELARTGAPSPGLGWAFAGLCLVAALARVIAQVMMIRLGQGAVSNLALRLCRKILALPLEQFEALDPAALTAVLTEDVTIVAYALGGIPVVAVNLPIVAACLAYGAWLAPAAVGLGLLVAVPAVGGYLALSNRAMRSLRAARVEQVTLVANFRALIDGFRELKLHRGRRVAFVDDALAPSAAAVRDRTVAGLNHFAAAAGWAQVASFGFIGVLLFVLPGLVGLDRATVAGVVLVVLFLLPSLDAVLTWAPALGRARASIARIEALLPALESVEETAITPAAPPALRESIELEGVTFAYGPEPEDGGFTLGPVNLSLRPGEIVFLVGRNGSGKTTLVKLVSGLYPPRGGSIRLDGRPIADEDREVYRQLFTVVFADGHLFTALHGLDPHAIRARAGHELRRLGLGGRVELRDGRLSDGGLSVGQRRRLALLAALLEDRPVCILDEWAAHQDPASRHAFYRELLPDLKARGKALLVITHDEDQFEVADRILQITGGQVREVNAIAIADPVN